MLKILHWPLKENQENVGDNIKQIASVSSEITEVETQESGKQNQKKPAFGVLLTDNVLHISFSILYSGDYRQGEVDINIDANAKKILDIFLKEGTDYNSVDITEAYAYCGRFGYSTNYFDKKKLARVVIDDKKDIYLVFYYACNDIAGVENVVMIKGRPSSYYLQKECPWLSSVQRLADKKYQLLKKMDCYRTVAYLEAQVDILTRIILASLPADSEYREALEAADAHSVLQIKPSDALLVEFNTNKSKVRKFQEEYYEVLHE